MGRGRGGWFGAGRVEGVDHRDPRGEECIYIYRQSVRLMMLLRPTNSIRTSYRNGDGIYIIGSNRIGEGL